MKATLILITLFLSSALADQPVLDFGHQTDDQYFVGAGWQCDASPFVLEVGGRVKRMN